MKPRHKKVDLLVATENGYHYIATDLQAKDLTDLQVGMEIMGAIDDMVHVLTAEE